MRNNYKAWDYYRFKRLPHTARILNKIADSDRFDCISHTISAINKGQVAPYSKNGLTTLVNGKGQLYLTRGYSRNIVKVKGKIKSVFTLTHRSLNFSSVLLENFNLPHIGYGYPNPNPLLKNGSQNPLYLFKDEGYLFVFHSNDKDLEILVIPGGKAKIREHYKKWLKGEYTSLLKEFRMQAQPFYNYLGFSL